MRLLPVALLAVVVAPAHAAPDDLISRPLVLPYRAVEARLTVGVDVVYQRTTQLASFAPDLWWGIWPRWSFGLVHSGPSLDQIDADATLCAGDSPVCARGYQGALDLRYSALEGPLSIAPRLRAIVRDTQPFKPAMALGAQVRWRRGRFAVSADPYVRIPLANHSSGNRAALFVPVWFEVQPTCGLVAFVHTGYDASFAVLRDGGHIPFALGATARVTGALELGVEAGWAALLGKQHDYKHGAVLLSATWRP